MLRPADHRPSHGNRTGQCKTGGHQFVWWERMGPSRVAKHHRRFRMAQFNTDLHRVHWCTIYYPAWRWLGKRTSIYRVFRCIHPLRSHSGQFMECTQGLLDVYASVFRWVYVPGWLVLGRVLERHGRNSLYRNLRFRKSDSACYPDSIFDESFRLADHHHI